MSIPRNDPSGFYHYESGATRILGQFEIDTGAIPAASQAGPGYTVAYTGAGDYLVTLTERFSQIVCASACVLTAANNTDRYCQIAAITVGAAPTVQILCHLVGANTDPPNNDFIQFEIVVRSEWLDA